MTRQRDCRQQRGWRHAALLLGLPVGFDWRAGEDDRRAIVVAGLRNKHLEGPYLIAAYRTHMTRVDG
jgi:hypothetical protein